MNRMNKVSKVLNGSVVVALMLAFVSSSQVQASFSDKNTGTRTAQFLKLPVGARAIGMGEAYTAVADDANAIYYNAAGLARLDKKSGEYMYSGIMVSNKVNGETDPSEHWIAFAMPISETIGSAGIGIQYFNAGDINETDLSNRKVGTFAPTDMAVNLAYARKYADFGLGLNLKIISSKIKESATTVGVDLGTQYDKLMEGKLLLGLAVQNIGGQMKFESESSKLPILFRLGTGYKVKENWVASFDIVAPEDNQPYMALGTDYKYAINEEMNVSGRGGYNSRANKVDGFNGLTIGLGFGFKMVSLDYAWMPLGDLGTTHRVSLGVKF